MTPTWPALLSALLGGASLDATDTAWAMREVMQGAASPAQVAAFVVALRAKGETAQEVAGLVEVMLEQALPVEVAGRVDTCGTGGDRSNTVNISTMAALVVAGTGTPVCKHGNRAASSNSRFSAAFRIARRSASRCADRFGPISGWSTLVVIRA